MAKKASPTALAREQRRSLVSSLLARNPRVTQRQIQALLAKPTDSGGLRNPNTGEAYSLGTINGDVAAIRQGWRERRQSSADEWITRTLATYEEIEIQAWRDGDLARVESIANSRAKLLGLNAPSKIAPTTPDGTQQYEGQTIIHVHEHFSEET